MRQMVVLVLLLALSSSVVWGGVPSFAADETLTEQHAAMYYDASMLANFQSESDPTIASMAYSIRRQGNDSNCDYIAVSNGMQNIGGDGASAYQQARALVAQHPRDYHESFYTLLGPDGSDRPFSLDNLGAAPEAFVGVYEALGYNAVMLATQPGHADLAFAQAIYDRLAAYPQHSFAHLWITPRTYNSHARILTIPETGEHAALVYPYHEVVAMVSVEQPGRLVILDGLVGYPFSISIDTLAHQLRGFNRVIIVSTNHSQIEDHQRFQVVQAGQPFVTPTLGGPFLTLARQLGGPGYHTWFQVIGQPYRTLDATGEAVIVPGEYVHYERRGASYPTLVPLGRHMAHDLLHMVGISTDRLDQHELVNGIRIAVEQQFGSIAGFEQIFGSPLTPEFWLSHEQLAWLVLRGSWHPLLDVDQEPGYICVLTERAMLCWHAQTGTTLIPLGRIFYEQHQHQVREP